MARTIHAKKLGVGTAVGLALALTLSSAMPASADIIIDGPINLGTADTYGVLGASAVTNTGPTVVNGDVGVSPDTSVTGFGGAPDGTINGTLHQTDAAAAQAQTDTTTAFNVAASLTPMETGLTELAGLSLTPGVYSGGALSLSNNNTLTLAGSAQSVWVFQAASTLTIGSATSIIVTGGASACNVFWQVGSSASIGTGAQFQGTILAQESVTATTGATVVGRLLARVAAVTLDTNTITAPTGCPPPGTPSETAAPVITTTTLPSPTVGSPYQYTIVATGNPAPTFAVTGGSLPAGMVLDTAEGTIGGTPIAPGTSTFTITASNGQTPASSVTYTVTVLPAAVAPGTPGGGGGGSATPGSGGTLAATGVDPGPAAPLAVLALLVGSALLFTGAARRRGRSA